MHPIVREFINTNERLALIIEKYADKEDPLESVFLKLGKSFSSNEVLDQSFYLELENAIIKGHSDTNVYFLFISYAILFTCYRLQNERAEAIQSVGASISLDKIHPTLQSYYVLAKATLKIYERKAEEGNKLIKEAMALVDKKSLRYITILINMASLISEDGRLNELSQEEWDLLDAQDNEFFVLITLTVKIKNCLFTGNAKEGLILIEEFKKKNAVDDANLKRTKVYLNLLKIISGDFDEENYDMSYFKNYAKANLAFANGHLEEAAKYIELMQKDDPKKLIDLVFRLNLPLHIELSLGNKGKARLMFQEMTLNNSPQYFDDFFLARIQLLEMNREGAEESFRRLMINIKKYGAMNRLIYELQFAKELKSSDVLLFMNGIYGNVEIKAPKIKIGLPINQNYKSGTGVKLLIGSSKAISQVKELVKKFASLKEPVLITGETGTGKELISRAIHDEGPHAKEPFLAINCGALTDSLLQSELFGYEAGAFTGAQKEHKGIFEAAGKGTVFLDEFEDISAKMQVSLLRVLESKEIRLIGGTKNRQIECKIVIATNIDLHHLVEEKKFREDLYFRLARFDIKLPPLRDRVQDISKLIDHFLSDHDGASENRKLLSNDLLAALMEYRWPGNIRELKNEIERLKILHADKKILDLQDFDFTRLQGAVTVNSISENNLSDNKLPFQKPNKKERIIEEAQILKIFQRGSKADERHEFIKNLFSKYKKLTRRQVVEIAAVSPATATKELELLCQAGFIERKTPTKSSKSIYFILAES